MQKLQNLSDKGRKHNNLDEETCEGQPISIEDTRGRRYPKITDCKQMKKSMNSRKKPDLVIIRTQGHKSKLDVYISNSQKLCCHQDVMTSINWTYINTHLTMFTHRMNLLTPGATCIDIQSCRSVTFKTIKNTGSPDKHKRVYTEATSYNITRRGM